MDKPKRRKLPDWMLLTTEDGGASEVIIQKNKVNCAGCVNMHVLYSFAEIERNM